ncbi:MAG: hypothetical protein HY785_03745 [Oscillatoriophycideae cyanobacterium NC_groundwater_1537_Pr4_S-0.65um_50_18]|nr:hypothetical protein [Oscillatoriophycideae cyanobacterium NC_groundwater_1537_Pr4_S-0.65um_50_18]
MNGNIAVGTALALSSPILNTAANAVGVAKTGTAIGTLTGAAHTSATAAWVGLGSMKVGMFMMGAFPVIGVLLILDGISGRDYGSPLIDWYEESWRRYEAQCELEELKKEIKVDSDHQLRAKGVPVTLAQQEHQFRMLEAEHEVYLMKKEMGIGCQQNRGAKREGSRSLVELGSKSLFTLHMPNVGLKIKVNPTNLIGFVVSEFWHTKWHKHMLEIKPVNGSTTTYVSFSDVSLAVALDITT